MDEPDTTTPAQSSDPVEEDAPRAAEGPADAANEDAPIAESGPAPVLESTEGTLQGPTAERDRVSAGAPITAPASTAGVERAIEALGELAERMDRRLGAIQALIERDQRAESSRERIVDRLHAELQEYKQDLLLQARRPIFIDLIQLHDDLGKMIEARERESEQQQLPSAERGPSEEGAPPEGPAIQGAAIGPRALLEPIRTAIEDVLYRQGVEPFWDEGPAFNPKRQRAVATVTTDEPGLNKTIAARVRPGFQSGEKMIRPELVTVHAHRPPRNGAPSLPLEEK